MGSIYPHIKAGRVRPLATTWPTRLKELPDVPTMAEAGYPGIGTNAWNGLFAPAKISKAMLTKLHDDVVKAMEAPDTKVALDKQYMSVVVNKTPAEFQQFVEDDVKKWAKVLEETHIKIE
jgi:tripartite-type tricarboxylate transporter receptor subunit TctC